MTGYAELFLADGKLERQTVQGIIRVPDVRLEGEWLIWEFGRSRKHYTPAEGLLGDFLQLATAPDLGIYQFARQRGVLEICRHGVPSTHNPGVPPGVSWPSKRTACQTPARRRAGPFKSLKERTESPIEQKEPLSAWRAFAREAAGILRVAIALRSGRETTAGDWQDVFARDPFVRARASGRAIPWWPINIRNRRGQRAFDQLRLASKVNDWLMMGNLRPTLDWFAGPSRVVFASRPGVSSNTTLFGALALQLLLVVSGTKGWALCSACGDSFPPARRPRQDQRAYCSTCRESGTPWRDAKRDERARPLDGLQRIATEGVTGVYKVPQVPGGRLKTPRQKALVAQDG